MKVKMNKFIIFFVTVNLLFTMIGCRGISKNNDVITITVWHTYVEQMRISMDELIEEFNNTVGKDKGIVVKVTAVANAPVINEKIMAAANRDPGAPALPNIAVIYPKLAVNLTEKGIFIDFQKYFSKAELDKYVPAFLDEGKLGGQTVYLLPVAKSTEVLYVNKTFFDRFSKATGVQLSQLATFEGIIDAAQKYYDWTDAQTPNIANDGAPFYYPDNLFNYTMIGFEQMGENFIKGQELNLNTKVFERIWNSYYLPAARGSVAIFNDYGNYLAQTGSVVCVSSTLAGAIFYPSTVTYKNNTKENVEFTVLPYPVFKEGKKVAIQRGGGMCITKSTPEEENASALFLKWLTAPEQNLRFAVKAGYLPVMKESFDKLFENKVFDTVKNENIKKALNIAIEMYKDYHFYFPSAFDNIDKLQISYVNKIQKAAQDMKDKNTIIDNQNELRKFRDSFDK